MLNDELPASVSVRRLFGVLVGVVGVVGLWYGVDELRIAAKLGAKFGLFVWLTVLGSSALCCVIAKLLSLLQLRIIGFSYLIVTAVVVGVGAWLQEWQMLFRFVVGTLIFVFLCRDAAKRSRVRPHA